jgi:uncharacterized protein (DUF2147 family)
LAFAPLAPAHAAPSAVDTNWLTEIPTGRWMLPSHDAVIQIVPCGTALCGQIVGMVLAPTDPVPKDWTGVSQCDLTIIRVAPERGDDGQWVWQGTIVNPRDGSAYQVQLKIGMDRQLKLRGYVGLPIFGRTQSWTSYTGPDAAADCRLPDAIRLIP